MEQGQNFAINRRFTLRKCTVEVKNDQSFQWDSALLPLRTDKEEQSSGCGVALRVHTGSRRRLFLPYVRSITGIDCRGIALRFCHS
jgi:hypothetical protein